MLALDGYRLMFTGTGNMKPDMHEVLHSRKELQ